MAVSNLGPGGATEWSYDPIANVVQFDPNYLPGPGSSLTLTYPVVCYP